jgi:hypothetical protein
LADQPDSLWPALLDEMEAELARDLDPGQSVTWAPPADAGPIPAHLFDRARLVIDAQQRAIAELTGEQESVARHLAALRTVPSGAASGRSVYLDVVG